MYKVIEEGSYQGMLDPRIMTSEELKNLPYEKRIYNEPRFANKEGEYWSFKSHKSRRIYRYNWFGKIL
jgi:hypothetical protein